MISPADSRSRYSAGQGRPRAVLGRGDAGVEAELLGECARAGRVRRVGHERYRVQALGLHDRRDRLHGLLGVPTEREGDHLGAAHALSYELLLAGLGLGGDVTGLEPADGDHSLADPSLDQLEGVGQPVGQNR